MYIQSGYDPAIEEAAKELIKDMSVNTNGLMLDLISQNGYAKKCDMEKKE